MVSPTGHNVIVFNGEIYNFKSIKTELEKSGAVFQGHSDTEVLLTAIEHYGFDNAISKAKGMFAIAHWDAQKGILNLARDRIGEKPLYYGTINGTFVFASELKAIYPLFPARTLTIDQQALNSFLRYGYISAPQCIFSELKKLSPGCKVEINIDDWQKSNKPIEDYINVHNYWSIEDCVPKTRSYDDQATDQALTDLDQLLNKIIQEQAASDVPLGAFLSGGIDSSLVTSLLQSQSDTAIETFTIGFHEKDFNEAEHAKRIAKHLGSNHNELYLSANDALSVIPSLPDIYDEPFADASQIPTYLVSQFAKSKLTVCLSGDGGDELFNGYNRYFQGARFNDLSTKIPKFLRTLGSSTISKLSPPLLDKVYQTVNRLLARKGGANFGAKVHKAAAAINFSDADALYQFLCSYSQQPSQLLTHATQDTTLNPVLPFKNDFLNAAMAWDQQWYLPGDNLVKSDRASMAVSLEMRVPLLDKELIEFSWQLPNSMKYREGKSKWILRQLLYQYVPKQLIDRPKMGFSIPISHWIREELKEWAASLLSKEFIQRQGLFNFDAVDQVFQEHLAGRVDNGNQLWTLLMFQSWYEKHYL